MLFPSYISFVCFHQYLILNLDYDQLNINLLLLQIYIKYKSNICTICLLITWLSWILSYFLCLLFVSILKYHGDLYKYAAIFARPMHEKAILVIFTYVCVYGYVLNKNNFILFWLQGKMIFKDVMKELETDLRSLLTGCSGGCENNE